MASHVTQRSGLTLEEAIKAYFALRLPHNTILRFLQEYHGVQLSLRTLRRRLCEYGLRRHYYSSCSDDSLVQTVREELSSAGGSIGYRQMWHNLRVKHHIYTSREKVR